MVKFLEDPNLTEQDLDVDLSRFLKDPDLEGQVPNSKIYKRS